MKRGFVEVSISQKQFMVSSILPKNEHMCWKLSQSSFLGDLFKLSNLQNDKYWDNQQQSQAQSDWCKMQMAFGSARWPCEFLGTA